MANVGKSTLFNALTLRHGSGQAHLAKTGAYPFTTVDPNVGVVAVPDKRLEKIAKIMGSAKVTPAAIEFVDIAGLVKGAHKGEGLGNEFLSHMRTVDAIVHIVRAFDDPNVDRAGSTTPQEDIKTVAEELRARDEEIEKRKKTEKGGEHLETAENLSDKPVLYVFNIDEHLIGKMPQELVSLQKKFNPSIVLSAKIEQELAELPEADQQTFLKEYGLDHSRIPDLIQGAKDLLQLITFFTANKNEARSWLTLEGTSALEAAGKVHTDMERGFIRAEVVRYEDLIVAAAEGPAYAGARAKGRVRDEGKEYIVKDGDIMLFKFSI